MPGTDDSVRAPRSNPPRGVSTRIALLLERIIFYGLLTVMAFTAIIPFGGLEPWWARSFECAVFILTALWIIEGLVSGEWGVKGRSMLLPLIVLTIFAFAQTLPLWSFGSESIGVEGVAWKTLSVDPFGTRRVALKLLTYVIFFALLLRYTYSKKRLQVLFYVLIGIGLASALFGFARQGMQETPGFVLPYLKPAQGYGQFVYHNAFALLMVMCVGLVLGLIIKGGVRRDRVLIYLGIALPLWTALVLSNSRGGILSMIGQMPFLAILYGAGGTSRKNLEKSCVAHNWFFRATGSMIVRATLVLGLMVVLAISALWLGGDSLVKKLAQDEILEQDEITAGSGFRGLRRIDVWRQTWPMIRANAVAGVGFGAYWVAIDKHLNTSGRIKPYAAHNDYLDILASGGLIGLALAGWFVFLVIKRARIQLRSTDRFRSAACAGALVGLFGVAVHSLFDFTLQISLNSVVFVALVVIATAEIGGGGQKSESRIADCELRI